MKLNFTKIDIATGRLEEMVDFYQRAFSIGFEEIHEGKWILYKGVIGNVIFFLCPNEPSGTEKGQPGVHQFHLQVENLQDFLSELKSKGFIPEPVPFGEGSENYCLRDPDGHPWIFSS